MQCNAMQRNAMQCNTIQEEEDETLFVNGMHNNIV